MYVGMDVHRKRSQAAICDEAGVVQRNRSVPNDPAELQVLLGPLPAGTPVAFEAAYGWGWLVDLLGDLELEAHLVHPSRCKQVASIPSHEPAAQRSYPSLRTLQAELDERTTGDRR